MRPLPTHRLALAAALLLAPFATEPLSAQLTTGTVIGQVVANGRQWFGRDLRSGSDPANFVSQANRVNSTAAHNAFTAGFPVTFTETFDGYALSAPCTLAGGGAMNNVNAAQSCLAASGLVSNAFGALGTTATFVDPNATSAVNALRIVNRTYTYVEGSNTLVERNYGRYAIDDAAWMNGGQNVNGQYLRNQRAFDILFSGAGVSSLGFWGVDFGDVGRELMISFYNGGTLLHSAMIDNLGSANANVLFYGYALDGGMTFDKVRFTTGTQNDGFAFDNLIVGSTTDPRTVPEPASFALVAIGAAGLVAVRRRRA